MNDFTSRRARKQTPDRRYGRRFGRHGRRARAAAAIALTALAVLGAIPVAHAATGGASGYEAPPPTASSGEEVAFGPLRYAGASWYGGPTMWGRTTACGEVLRPRTIGVAHKTLPCGTIVKFVYHGRTVTAPVIDRGPYVKGRAWDLTAAASEAIGLEGVGRVGYRVAVEYARR